METRMVICKEIIFLVHSLESGFGGMESHQNAFIRYFIVKQELPIICKYVVENKGNNYKVSIWDGKCFCVIYATKDIEDIMNFFKVKQGSDRDYIFVLNDSWWIEYIYSIRNTFKENIIAVRLGGNDIELAPWNIGGLNYSERRLKWKDATNQVNYVIANSNYSYSLLTRLGTDKTRIVKIRGGVDDTYRNLFLSQKSLCRQWMIDKHNIENPIILTFASRFVPFKGIIQALEAIKNSYIAKVVHILLIGDGCLADEIKSYCMSNFSHNQYSIVGVLSNEETLKYLAASDYLVNASIEYIAQSGDGNYIHTETMGRSMIEAISVGTKILATDVGGTSELFEENGFIGILTKPQRSNLIDMFNEACKKLHKEVEVKKDYGWNSVFTEYMSLFK